MLSGMMSLCKVGSPGEAGRAVVGGAGAAKSGNCGRIASHCVFDQRFARASFRASEGCRKVCSIRVASHSGRLGGSWGGGSRGGGGGGGGGGGVAKCSINFGRGTLNSAEAGREQALKYGFRVSLTSLSRLATQSSRRKPSGRLLHCRAEARLSDVSKASSSASGDATSTSVSSPPSLSQRGLPTNLVAGVGITAAVVMMAVLGFMAKPSTNGGSVAELIKRGQLRSDRGVDSKTLMYDDPFNNPFMKVGNKNPIVKMCGKLFRLAPVTLTDEKVLEHQNRRIHAYKWRRPIVFLNEGQPVPEGVDPEEVRWIPSNHPFATTTNHIDEELAQKNVYQTRGVPSRVRAEHEALRKKLLDAARVEPEFQFPDLENSGAMACKTSDETPETPGTVSGDEGEGQVNGRGEGNAPRNLGLQGGTKNGVSDSRYRTIDFSGEEQGSGRS